MIVPTQCYKYNWGDDCMFWLQDKVLMISCMPSLSQLSTYMPWPSHSYILHDNSYAHAGMLSKAKVWIGATIHVLFHWQMPHSIPISADVLKTTINFVDLSTQHATYLASSGDVEKSTRHGMAWHHCVHAMAITCIIIKLVPIIQYC